MEQQKVKKLSVDFLEEKIKVIKKKANNSEMNEKNIVANRLMFELSKKIDSFLEESMGKDGLVGEAWIVLVIIYSSEQEQLYATELCEHLCKSKATMSRIVESLKDKGFIVEIPNLKDRRKSILSITDNGKKFVEKKVEYHNNFYNKSCDNINVDYLIQNLSKMLENIYQLEGEK